MCKHIYNPETNYPKGTSFTYLISWTDLDIHYYGVRYSKDCHPDDLWNIYFTSSTYVKEFIKLNGDPDIVKVDFVYDTAKEARYYEEEFLKENDCAHNSRWINLCNNSKDFCQTEDSIKRKSEANKDTIWINNGVLQRKVKKEVAELLFLEGWVKNKLHKCVFSFEHRQKLLVSRKNRVVSEETKLKTSNALKNRPKSKEAVLKSSKTRTGMIGISNGIVNKKIKPEKFDEYAILGFTLGWQKLKF